FDYTGRQNFGWAVKSIQQELGLSPSQLGTISGAMLACYGLGQVANGNLGDRFGGRQMVSLGALLSFCLNWVTSFGDSFWSLLITWEINAAFSQWGGRLEAAYCLIGGDGRSVEELSGFMCFLLGSHQSSFLVLQSSFSSISLGGGSFDFR